MTDLPARLAALRSLLAEKLGVGPGDLSRQIRRAGRRLPRRLRRDAAVLARAEPLTRHPRLSRLIDPAEVHRAEARLARHLSTIDPVRQRRDRRQDRLAAVGFYILVTFALVVTVLWWRGYV
ncbi:hypothetical protein FHG66_04300 [Rubellimicrobium rubrum]|uniref:Uncharacterized protein n=1 Tax=Rubellimicrobium rubrum TaxID=2585369 RepID=A0A5C4N0D5_9RHOB|nr:hypothetical protein [Rubellimicrobium rubrum]TNC52026.1 hypothetical protein FHG66_04300 [Rubellimicrobium rubrum]